MQLKAPNMKTTVEVPDDLYRQAKAEAALRGRKLKLIGEVCGSFWKRRARPAGTRAWRS